MRLLPEHVGPYQPSPQEMTSRLLWSPSREFFIIPTISGDTRRHIPPPSPHALFALSLHCSPFRAVPQNVCYNAEQASISIENCSASCHWAQIPPLPAYFYTPCLPEKAERARVIAIFFSSYKIWGILRFLNLCSSLPLPLHFFVPICFTAHLYVFSLKLLKCVVCREEINWIQP